MTTYRAYRLDDRHKIKNGLWLEARSDDDAKEQAGELCEEDSAAIELWQAARLVEEIDCEPD